MAIGDDEEERLRSVVLRNAESVLRARRRAEEELVRAKEALEQKTEELAHSLAMMRATLESTTDGILVTDRDGHVTGFNQQYMEMWRIPHETMETREHRRLIDVCAMQFTDPQAFTGGIDRIYATAPSDSFDVLRLTDGRVLERSSRIQFVDDRNVGRVWSFRDITERLRAAEERERLLEAERAARSEAERVSMMKDEFLATLSHELRTPLNAILGWSQILSLGRSTGEDLRQGLAAIERSARAQTRLIEDLLDMSRIISGKVRLDVQRTDLDGVVNAAIESVRPSAEAKGIRLRSIVDHAAGPVSGDPNRLQQVVWNLLTNAVKFTPKEGRIDILVQRVNSHIEIAVNDSGIGIDSEFLPHVFERFRQADSSMTRNFGGLGIGLSIVKQIVELHGGNVRAESAGAGRGASFTVSLPVAPVREAANRGHPATPSSPSFDYAELGLAGVKVLVVDDEPAARALIERVLAECNADVITAASAVEGLEILQKERPQVLVSDIGMPGKDGFQFIREVRLLPAAQGGRTPAIALTAFARSEDRVRAMLAGYQVHISKPIEPQELLATVRSLVERHAGT